MTGVQTCALPIFLEKIHADGLLPPGMSLCVTDTRGSHSELTGELAASFFCFHAQTLLKL